MKDIPVYFTHDEYDAYRNGELAIGYTAEQKKKLELIEQVGIDCELKTEPLSHMTKVRPVCVSSIEWADTGVYVCRPGRPH